MKFSPGIVLHYHRIAELPIDPNRLCVEPRRFAEQLAYLNAHASPMPLAELLDAVRRGATPARAVAITFDDGYADNFHCARPLLEQHRIAATIFVATGFLDGSREFWWDDLERLIFRPEPLPRTIALIIRGRERRFRTAPSWLRIGERFLGRRLEPRRRLYARLHRELHALPHGQRLDVLDQLQHALGMEPGVRPTHRILSREDVRHLARSSHFRVGAHTVTHPVLSSLDPSEQRAEIAESKLQLEAITDTPVDAFAYPYGGSATYTDVTVAAVREAGFTIACTTQDAAVGAHPDPFRIPRVPTGNWSAGEFALRLASYRW